MAKSPDGAGAGITIEQLLKAKDLRPVGVVVQEVNGRKVHHPTLLRWIHRGVGGIKLKAVFVGQEWRTTTAAYHEFVLAKTRQRLEERSP